MIFNELFLPQPHTIPVKHIICMKMKVRGVLFTNKKLMNKNSLEAMHGIYLNQCMRVLRK